MTPDACGLVLRDVEVDGVVTSMRIADGVIAAVGADVRGHSDDAVIDGDGGALLHGLHDHHVHVHALAAAHASVTVGPPAVSTAGAFAASLREAARTGAGSVRAVGYHERVAGVLDRRVLDAIVADVPVRVQHRSGGLWVLNSAAIRAALARSGAATDDRIERDDAGEPTGRLWRADDLVRDHDVPVDLASVGTALARLGVTALTDATATNDASTVERLATLPQRVRAMGPLDLVVDENDHGDHVELGEVKVLLDDDRLPPFDDTVALVGAAHARGRGVAFHCVTLVQLEFALAVLRSAGSQRDRIEHASVAPPDAIATMRELDLTVATQPSFVAERGDDYLLDVDPRDVDALYPVRSLCRAGVRTLGSTDAPYTTFDPWAAMRAAVERRTASGAIVGAPERVDSETALGLFGAFEPVVVGATADVMLLRVPRADVLERLDGADVVATIVGGTPISPSRS